MTNYITTANTQIYISGEYLPAFTPVYLSDGKIYQIRDFSQLGLNQYIGITTLESFNGSTNRIVLKDSKEELENEIFDAIGNWYWTANGLTSLSEVLYGTWVLKIGFSYQLGKITLVEEEAFQYLNQVDPYSMYRLKAQSPLQVCKEGGIYDTIQASIDAANVGDTIYVSTGEYVEDVTIEKDIKIFCEDGVILNGILSIADSNVSISKMSIHAINSIGNSGHIILTDCIIDDIVQSGNCLLEIRNSTVKISLESLGDMVLDSCQLQFVSTFTKTNGTLEIDNSTLLCDLYLDNTYTRLNNNTFKTSMSDNVIILNGGILHANNIHFISSTIASATSGLITGTGDVEYGVLTSVYNNTAQHNIIAVTLNKIPLLDFSSGGSGGTTEVDNHSIEGIGSLINPIKIKGFDTATAGQVLKRGLLDSSWGTLAAEDISYTNANPLINNVQEALQSLESNANTGASDNVSIDGTGAVLDPFKLKGFDTAIDNSIVLKEGGVLTFRALNGDDILYSTLENPSIDNVAEALDDLRDMFSQNSQSDGLSISGDGTTLNKFTLNGFSSAVDTEVALKEGGILQFRNLTAGDVGADPIGTASGIMTAHEADTNPHPQYLSVGGTPSIGYVPVVSGTNPTVVEYSIPTTVTATEPTSYVFQPTTQPQILGVGEANALLISHPTVVSDQYFRVLVNAYEEVAGASVTINANGGNSAELALNIGEEGDQSGDLLTLKTLPEHANIALFLGFENDTPYNSALKNKGYNTYILGNDDPNDGGITVHPSANITYVNGTYGRHIRLGHDGSGNPLTISGQSAGHVHYGYNTDIGSLGQDFVIQFHIKTTDTRSGGGSFPAILTNGRSGQTGVTHSFALMGSGGFLFFGDEGSNFILSSTSIADGLDHVVTIVATASIPSYSSVKMYIDGVLSASIANLYTSYVSTNGLLLGLEPVNTTMKCDIGFMYVEKNYDNRFGNSAPPNLYNYYTITSPIQYANSYTAGHLANIKQIDLASVGIFTGLEVLGEEPNDTELKFAISFNANDVSPICEIWDGLAWQQIVETDISIFGMSFATMNSIPMIEMNNKLLANQTGKLDIFYTLKTNDLQASPSIDDIIIHFSEVPTGLSLGVNVDFKYKNLPNAVKVWSNRPTPITAFIGGYVQGNAFVEQEVIELINSENFITLSIQPSVIYNIIDVNNGTVVATNANVVSIVGNIVTLNITLPPNDYSVLYR